MEHQRSNTPFVHFLFLSLFSLIAGSMCHAQTTPAAPAPKPVTLYNVALNKTFTDTAPGDSKWRGLVDGISNADVPPDCYATDNSPQFPKSILLDLGGLFPIRQIVVTNSLNGNTKSITLYYSPNRSRWDPGWKFVFPAAVVRELTYTLPDRMARYVKIVLEDTYGGGFSGDNVLYLREVQALSPAKEPVSLARNIDRSRWNVVSRDYSIVKHLTLDRNISPRIVLVGYSMLEAADKPGGYVALLQKMLKEKYLSAATSVPDGTVTTLRIRPQWFSGASVFPADLRELPQAEVMVVVLGVDDLPRSGKEAGGAVRKLLTAVKRVNSQGAIVGVIAPSLTAIKQAGKPVASPESAEFVAAIRQAMLGEACSILDLNAVAQAMGEEVGVFDEENRLSEEGHQFIAEEVFNFLVKGSAGK